MAQNTNSSSDLAHIAKTVGKIGLGTLAVGVGGAALVNGVLATRTPPLGPRLNGLFDRYPARYCDAAYVVAGSGSPLLLLHGLDAGRSMAEWRHVFDALADRHTVYALDWPGCGLSDPAPEGLDAMSFAELARHFVRDVIGEETTLIAAGQSAPLAALAASETDTLISQLVLVSPQTFDLEVAAGESRAETLLHRAVSSQLLRVPVVGQALLNWRHSQKALRRFVSGRALFDKSLVESEARLWHVSAHQKGACSLQSELLQGAFAFDWVGAWAKTDVPAALVWGRNAANTATGAGFVAASEWGALRPDADLHVIEHAMLLPHVEQPAAFCEVVLSWIAGHSGKA